MVNYIIEFNRHAVKDHQATKNIFDIIFKRVVSKLNKLTLQAFMLSMCILFRI